MASSKPLSAESAARQLGSPSITSLLTRTATLTARRRRATVAAALAAGLVAVALTLATTDVLAPLSDGLRLQLARGWLLIPAAALAVFGWRWWRAVPPATETIALAEQAFADRERRLTAAAELAIMPGSLARQASQTIAASFPVVNLPARLAPARWGRWLGAATVGLALAAVIAVALPDLARTVWLRFSDPTGDHPPWARTSLTWAAAPERVRAGATVHVEVEVTGDRAGTPVLHGGGAPVAMFPLGAGHWAAELSGVTTPLVLWAEAGGTRTLRHAVAIDPVPQLDGLTFTLMAPLWARLAPETVVWKPSVVSELAALPGTRLILRPTSNRALAAVIVQLGDQQTRLAVTAGAIEVVATPGPLAISLVASDGIAADPLPVALLSERPDAPPRLGVVRPAHDTLATVDRTVNVEFAGEDDFGLVTAVEVSAVNGSEAPPRRLAIAGERRWTRTRVLDLAALGARPGDVFTLGALVRDSNPAQVDGQPGQPSGFATRTIRVITDEEYNQQIRRRLPPNALEHKYGDLLKRMAELEQEAAALRAAAAAAAAGGAAPELDRRLAELGRKAAALAAEVRALHRDKPLYAIEQDLQEELAAAAEQLAKAAEQGDATALPDRQRGRSLAADLAQLTELARAHGLAARLAQLADAEQNTTGRIAPLADHRRVGDADRVRLRELAGNEDELAQAVEAWPGLAGEVATRLRGTDPDIAAELDEVAKLLSDSGVADLKRQAAAACRAGDGATALALAAEARDRLLALLPKAGQCQGSCRSGLRFSWCRGSNASDALGLGFGVGIGGWGAGGAGSGGLGLLLGYGGDDQGGSWMQESLDLAGPEALGDLGGRIGDRDGPGIAELAAAGDGRTPTSAAGYQRDVRATTTTGRARLDASEERLIGDYLRRLTNGGKGDDAKR